jgi:hypothetical protein
MLETGQVVAELTLFPGARFRPLLLQLAHTRLGDQRPATKAGELVAKMPHELLELTERKCFRTFAV